jgi:hypothetical protein
MDLQALGGNWRGAWRTWVEPNELYSESPIEATVTPMFDGKAAVLRYTAELDGPVEGFTLLGRSQEGAVVAWIDTWHTSGLVMTSHGATPNGAMDVATTFRAGDEEWRWTSEYSVEDGRLVIRHYNEGPDVPRYLGVEAILERSAD